MDKIAEDIEFLETKQYQYWYGSQNWEGFRRIIDRLKKLEPELIGTVNDLADYITDMQTIEYSAEDIAKHIINNFRLKTVTEPLPDNLDELADKLFHLIYPTRCEWEALGDERKENCRAAAAYVAPHLAIGLKPGDECRVKQNENGGWRAYEAWFIGRTKSGLSVVEYASGSIDEWEFCEPIPKKETYIKPLGRIMFEAEEDGWILTSRSISKDNWNFSIDDLFYFCGKKWDGTWNCPEKWKEER